MINLKNISYRTAESKKGPLTLFCTFEGREVPLHSAIDPLKERDILAGKLNPERFDVLVVLGLGLGYHLQAIKENLEKYRLIVLVDILSGIEKKIAENSHVSFPLKSENVLLLTGKGPGEVRDILNSSIDFSAINGLQVVEHPSSLRIFSSYYNGIRNIIEIMINKKAANEATKKAFGQRYLKNIVRNIPAIEGYIPVKSLLGRFKDYPALVVTSGPSLDGYISEIRHIQKNSFIIAVDSALPVLVKQDIIPDFVVSIDPQPYIYEHIRECNLKECIPVISISVHPSVPAYINSQRSLSSCRGVVSMNTHPLSQLITAVAGDMGSIDSLTGTVAGDAVCLAQSLGFSPVALAGFDFSFRNYQIYARGTAYQKRYAHYFQTRVVTIEGKNMEYIFKSSGALKADGHFTRKAFIRYKQALEEFISRSGQELISIDSSGLVMKDVPVKILGDVISSGEVPLDKTAVIKAVVDETETINSFFQRNKLKSLLDDAAIMRELLVESIGSDDDRGKYKHLIKNIF